MEISPIAHIETDFPEKFGIPRQSGLVEELAGRVVFLPEYRDPDALRGIEQFSHIWLLWEFSQAKRESRSLTVRPPRLGGNTRMGVFATRSPFRPNPIGLSVVKLIKVEYGTARGAVLHVAGADLMNGTPIYDVKPYLPYVDSKPDALGGFALSTSEDILAVSLPEELAARVPAGKLPALRRVLAQDPRPQYQSDPERLYTMSFGALEVRFRVEDGTAIVTDIFPR